MNTSLMVVAVLFGTCTLAQFARGGDPIDVSDRACLFLDDRFIAEQSGFTRTWHQGRPQPKPAIEAVPPAEDWPHAFGSTLYDPKDQTYKMWYESVHAGKGWLRYAESKDGKTWTKPNLGLVEIDGKKDNNVVFAPAELPNVFINPNATDPKDHLTIIAWCSAQEFNGEKLGGLYVFRSADGKDWEPIGGISGPELTDDTVKARTVLDTNQIIWDELGKRYYGAWRTFPTHPGLPGFTRDEKYQTTYGAIGGHRRAVAVATSDQLQSGWGKMREILRADAKDDEKAAKLGKDPAKPDYVEMYIMPVFVHGNHYFGAISFLYFVDGSDTVNGGGDIQLAFSDDGFEWKRPPDRMTLMGPIPEGRVPTYSMCNKPLDVGDEWWMYYTEADSAHPKTGDFSCIRAAVWRREGFVSMGAGEQKATLRTHPLKFSGTNLILNLGIADAGAARVALLDASGKTIPGFDLADCDALIGDHVAKNVTWKGKSDLTALRDKSIVVHIELTRGNLYSFRFGS